MNIPALSLRTSFDTDANGAPDTIIFETYNSDGNVLTSVVDSDADGQNDTVSTYTYNNDGIQTGLVVDNVGENGNTTTAFSFTSDYTVDTSGVATYTEVRLDLVNNTEDVTIYTFDSASNFIKQATGVLGEDGTVEEAQVVATYDYNSSGQVTAYEENGTRTEYTYDTAGRFTSITTPSSSIIYEYDEAGNFIRQESNSESFGNSVTTYTYDESNRLIELSNNGFTPNSPLGGSFSSQSTYGYNAASQVISYVQQSDVAGRSSGRSYSYEYDDAGNFIKESSVGTGFSSGLSSQTTYEYNAAGQITSYAVEQNSFESKIQDIRYTYEYDEIGNLTKESVDGFTLGGSSTPSDHITEYSYDDAGRITSFSIDADADGTLDDITSYEYDPILGGFGPADAVSESSSDMEADIFFDETAQSVVLGTGDTFSSGELVNSFLLESSTLLSTEDSLMPTDQFLI